MDYLKKAADEISKGATEAQNGNFLWIAIMAVIAIIGLYLLYFYGRKMIRNVNQFRKGSPYLLEETKDAKRRLVITQDPYKQGSINLPRSLNEQNGIEFSYSGWLFIDNYNYKLGQWKHVFHKGNETSWPLRAPGMWLHPDKNALRVYMNTYQEISEYVDIDNIPINKWFSFVISVKGQSLDVYINGNLKKSLKLTGIPKQNYSDVYINSFGGFSGYISNLRYYDFALNYNEIDGIVKGGPNLIIKQETRERPPYLTANWWTNDV